MAHHSAYHSGGSAACSETVPEELCVPLKFEPTGTVTRKIVHDAPLAQR